MNVISRRQVLSTAPVAFTGAFLSSGSSGLALGQSSIPSPLKVLNADLCNYCADQFARSTALIANGTATAADISLAASSVRLLAHHLGDIDFDTPLRAAIKAKPGVTLDKNNLWPFEDAYQRAASYYPSVDQSLFMPPNLSDSDIESSLTKVQSEGWVLSLQVRADQVALRAKSGPPAMAFHPLATPHISHAVYRNNQAAHLMRVSTPCISHVCSEIADYNDSAAVILWMLAFGCLPADPFFYVICPVILAAGGLAGVIMALTWACGKIFG